jgi:hypothetical protein
MHKIKFQIENTVSIQHGGRLALIDFENMTMKWTSSYFDTKPFQITKKNIWGYYSNVGPDWVAFTGDFQRELQLAYQLWQGERIKEEISEIAGMVKLADTLA